MSIPASNKSDGTMSMLEERLDTGTDSRLAALGSSLLHRASHPVVKGCLWVLLVAACLYRLLTFIPQPIDSPGTLRSYLYAVFVAFRSRYPSVPQAEASWNTLCLGLLLLPTLLALVNYFTVSKPRGRGLRLLCSSTVLFAAIGLALVACRFAVLLLPPLSPDESHLLASAHKLFIDPIFFRSVDVGTTGPFNVFPLMLPALAGLSPDYASTRLIGLLLMLGSVYAVYRAFCLIVEDHQARIALIPVAGAFAVIKFPDMLHYTSETVSLLLTSLAVLLCVRAFTRPERYVSSLFGLGFLAGTAFFAKMQAVPIILALGAVAAVAVYRTVRGTAWWHPSAALVTGCMVMPAVNAILCVATGVWYDFWMSYVVGNYAYGQVPTQEIWHFVHFVISVPEIRLFIVTLVAIMVVHGYNRTVGERPDSLPVYLKLSILGGATALAVDYALGTVNGSVTSLYVEVLCLFGSILSLVFIWQKESGGAMPVRWSGLTIAVFLTLSAYAVYAPHRFFPHYLVLLIIPVNMATSWPLLARFQEANSASENLGGIPSAPVTAFALVFVTLTATGLTVLQLSPGDVGFANVPPEIRAQDGDFIRAITHASDRITVWGWNTRPYLDSGRVAALRNVDTVNLFNADAAVTKFYQERFLRDIRRTPPVLFVDAVGPASFGGNGGQFEDRKRGGFELIPQIKSFIEANYVHVADGYNERFYMRRDARGPGNRTAEKCDPAALRCFDGTASSPAELPPVQIPKHALIDLVFIADDKPAPYATVFSNDPDVKEHAGLHFHHVADDQYELAAGLGNDWARSNYFLLPHKVPVTLSFELNSNAITIVENGVKRVEMRLPTFMLQSDSPITLGTWVDHQRPFGGKVLFFQIRDLGTGNATHTF